MTGLSGTVVGMRTDRLVAILLMLQRREQVTAAEVAKELEVSERTARRDLDALAMSGIPVYSIQGRGGGWRLLGGARTDLSGLTASEARALFLVVGPASTAIPAVKSALRKLVRALPEPFRAQAEAAASSLVLDPRRWGSTRAQPPPRFLDDLQDAVIRGVQVQLGYVDSTGAESERIVHPLGIVAKGPSWYLVAYTETGRRTFRIDRVSSAAPTDRPVHLPKDFDLAESWREISDDVDRRRTPSIEIHATCAPDGIDLLRIAVGDNLETGGATTDGRIAVVIRGPSEYGLAGHLAGLVEWLDITSPQGVQDHLAAIGNALTERYGGSSRRAATRTSVSFKGPR
jgi:predicted DNA-binding transcriptional regulator YafY